MRRTFTHPYSHTLRYEIRDIVSFAQNIAQECHIPITWENIGDPVQKGEPVPEWIRHIVAEKALESRSYAYSATEGIFESREFLAKAANQRRLGPLSSTISPDPCAPLGAEDILFFNGLGDAIGKLYSVLHPQARILLPSPCYPAHSNAESLHAVSPPITYPLVPLATPLPHWEPDLEYLEYLIQRHTDIVGILYINPDNPTGTTYTIDTLRGIVEIARRYKLFIIADETYGTIRFGDRPTGFLSQLIGDVPGISLRSLSKEIPWPGARCGWMEIYNRHKDPEFLTYIQTIVATKRLEVCATSLPQHCIPDIMGDIRYGTHLEHRRTQFAQRTREASQAFANSKGATLIPPEGGFFATVIFDKKAFSQGTSHEKPLPLSNSVLAQFLKNTSHASAPDKRFVYWLIGTTGICVVPLSGFTTDIPGFRFTLLEHDDTQRRTIFTTLAEATQAYLFS
ncbi:MAG: pyridoxal phosphate-dependent aminotransferase [Treponemataceae bacterium]|nr:pyridoxal phosphate-dependent aminotransferase [Treponemataceae bacterium]